jgi:pimeloyl-ACP methyl ester carboxylesterase
MTETALTTIAPTTSPAAPTSSGRWAGLAGRSNRRQAAAGRQFVFLHGLTFDCRMWDLALDALGPDHLAIAFDLPGHGGSPPLASHDLASVVDAIHEAVLDAELDSPIVVGHSIGGPIASLYGATHPAAAVMSIDAPIRMETFAQLLTSLRSELEGSGFAEAWAMFRASFHAELLADGPRALLRAGDRAADDRLQELVLGYQSDLLTRPLEETVQMRDDGWRRLREANTPYITLHSNQIDQADATWLSAHLPQAEIVVWPVGHHFPHLAHPARFAALLAGIAGGLPNATRRVGPTPAVTHETMDELADAHFRAEIANDLDAIAGGFTAEAEHDVAGRPGPALHGHDQIRGFYSALLAELEIRQFEPVRRRYGVSHLVDESILHGIARGRPFNLEGRNRQVHVRILHVFEFARGRISRESAWLDLAALQQQLAT